MFLVYLFRLTKIGLGGCWPREVKIVVEGNQETLFTIRIMCTLLSLSHAKCNWLNKPPATGASPGSTNPHCYIP